MIDRSLQNLYRKFQNLTRIWLDNDILDFYEQRETFLWAKCLVELRLPNVISVLLKFRLFC